MGRPRKNPLPEAVAKPERKPSPTDPVKKASEEFKEEMSSSCGCETPLDCRRMPQPIEEDLKSRRSWFLQSFSSELVREQIKAKGVALPDQARNAYATAVELADLLAKDIGW